MWVTVIRGWASYCTHKGHSQREDGHQTCAYEDAVKVRMAMGTALQVPGMLAKMRRAALWKVKTAAKAAFLSRAL